MTVYRHLLLLLVLFSLVAFACSPKSQSVKDSLKCEESINRCIDEHTLELCVSGEKPIVQACGAGLKCDAGACVDDGCSNGRLDAGEEAVDCGGLCAPCVSCRVHADCGEDGFCDSASDYVCSKRCRTNDDCDNNEAWDGNYCRGDGRCSPKVFETVWEVTENNLTVILPLDVRYSNSNKCDFRILWGDEPVGTSITTARRVKDCRNTKARTHKYSEPGRYHVKIIGTYDGWEDFAEVNQAFEGHVPITSNLRSVVSFGPVGLRRGAFYGAEKLEQMPKKDIPDASKLKDMSYFFAHAAAFNAAIGHWDTSQVTNMRQMFDGAQTHNQPSGTWDATRASYRKTDMNVQFDKASSFNQAIGRWDTSKVTDMKGMFSGAAVFNQPIGTWNVSSVTNMEEMFSKTSAFDQNLSAWNLNADVDLHNIFDASNMGGRNLCALKAAGGEWLEQWTTLAKGFFECDTLDWAKSFFYSDASAWAKGEVCCGAVKPCTESVNRCLDLKTIEHCSASKIAEMKTCGDGFVCDDAACASGGDCCVAAKLCTQNATQCLDLKTVEHCNAYELAQTTMCDKGLVCDAEACASGDDCCVASRLCSESLNQCLDLRTAEICVQNARAEVEICGEGFHCDLGACVVGKVCNKTENTCLDEDRLEICVADQRPSVQACAQGDNCDRGQCVLAACANHRLDAGEDAVDCGGLCPACVTCRVDADCGVDGFCDSASGYVCSKRCRSDKDCTNTEAWDGNYCRGDGRCSPKVFETLWVINLDGPTFDEFKREHLSYLDDDEYEDDITSTWEWMVILTNVEEPDVDEPIVVLPFDPDYPNAKCDFQILWGDEPEGTDITTLPRVTDCTKIENRTHTYAGSGHYHVKIIGTYDGWGAFDDINGSDEIEESGNAAPALASMLRGVISFGPVGLSSSAFHGASHLRTMPEKDIPDASKLKSMDETFKNAFKFDAPIGHWDTSRVTSMRAMFNDAKNFNQPIGNWDTSQVTDMTYMFDGDGGTYGRSTCFNQPIGDWNTGNVTNMSRMFSGNGCFNQPIGDWNTSKVESMAYMFCHAENFNQPIGNWDTSSVTDMSSMFSGSSHQDNAKFNQDLSKWVLKKGVNLKGTLSLTDMSESHLALLKAKGGEWLAQWDELIGEHNAIEIEYGR